MAQRPAIRPSRMRQNSSSLTRKSGNALVDASLPMNSLWLGLIRFRCGATARGCCKLDAICTAAERQFPRREMAGESK